MKDFEQICDNYLENLSEEIENFDIDTKFDVDYSDGILNIIFEEKNLTYVINRHSASQKIWFSSPISGADYFCYNDKLEKFINDKEIDLNFKLFKELKELIT